MLPLSSLSYEEDCIDREGICVLPEFLDGPAKQWFRHHVLHFNKARQHWTFKDVIFKLYNQFVSTSTMQDAQEAFYL